MGKQEGKTRTYGSQRKAQAWAFIAALQSQAIAESKGQNSAQGVVIKRIDWSKKTRSVLQQGKKGTNPRLVVKTTLTDIKKLVEVWREVKLTDDALRYVHNHSLRQQFLDILSDQREKTQGRGAENWHFILKLWHTGLNENEKRFNSEWQRRKSGDTEECEASDADATSIDCLERLEQLGRESRARCVERWQAAGVSEKEAEELTDDPSVGAPPPHIQLCDEKPILLIGEVGAGKSLIAERIFQSAIQQLIDNAHAPVPVYLEAKKVGHLQEAVEAAAIGIGNPQFQGATVIIDGADEAGTGLASQLLTEARRLRAWQKTTVIITSRPIPTFDKQKEAVRVPLLSLEDACILIERFAKQPITEFTASKWPEAVQDAIHRPLFAVLLGIYLHEQGMTVPKSIGELLSSLVERALKRQTIDIDKANNLLQKLAVLCIEYGGGPVFTAEVASSAELQPLLSPIPLDKLEECLLRLPKNVYQSFGIYQRLHRHDLNQLIREVNRLREQGKTELPTPWPKPEHEWTEGPLWKCYTLEQMRSHAETVYKGALDGYQQLVDRWFKKFVSRLKTKVLLPARFVGIVTPPQPNQELKSAPILKWCFEALPKSEQSTVDLRFAEQDLWDDIPALDDCLRSRRPEAVTWISGTTMHVSNLDVFAPNSATNLAYTWLWNDLKRVSWVDGFLGSPPR